MVAKDDGALLECLIEHKLESDASNECRAMIEHHQMLSYEDVTFSPRLVNFIIFSLWSHIEKTKITEFSSSGARWGKNGDPLESEKVVEKWSYFPGLYKMTNCHENRLKIGKNNFPLKFYYLNSKIFSWISILNWFLAQTRKICWLPFLITFRFTKDFQEISNLTF